MTTEQQQHRFPVGSDVRHVDTVPHPENTCEVVAHTWTNGHPSYTLEGPGPHGFGREVVYDVYDNDDLVLA